jgi:hypothetical protein
MLFAPSLLSLQPDLDEPKEEAGGEGCPCGQEEPTAINTGRYSGLIFNSRNYYDIKFKIFSNYLSKTNKVKF